MDLRIWFLCAGLLVSGGVVFGKKSLEEKHLKREVCEKESKILIDTWYKEITGFGIPENETQTICDVGGDATYGEITFDAVQKFIEYVKPTKKDVFYDLGCGVGKLVVEMFMQTPMKKVVGVELSLTRFSKAMQVQSLVEGTFGKKASKALIFKQEDIGTVDIHDATIIYLASTCYPHEFMKKIGDNIVTQARENVRIFTLVEFPREVKGLKKIDNLVWPMTWSQDTPVHVYVKN